MKLTIVVSVVLRLFAIQWLVMAFVGILGATGFVGINSWRGPVGGFLQELWPFAVPGSYTLLAILAWTFAGAISRCVVGAVDPEIRPIDIAPANLYTLGILLLGLYYCLGYLGPMINWLHYITLNRAGEAILAGSDGLSLYQVTSQVIPCLAGGIVAAASPKLGKKLASIRPAIRP